MHRIFKLEDQASIFQILVLIADRGEIYSAQLKREGFTPRTTDRVLERLSHMGLITNRLDDSAQGAFRRMYSLTPCGEEFMVLLREMEKTLTRAEKELAKKRM